MPAPRLPRRHRRRAAAVALLTATVGLTGCFTGERPEFQDEVAFPAVSVGNADIDAVLERLDRIGSSEFTAEYDIETRFGPVLSDATVVQAPGRRRSITVEDTRFLIDGDDSRTCSVSARECETGVNDARISQTQLSHEFYGPAFARRLRVSADRRTGDPEPFTETIAGQPATCVIVRVAGNNGETFCALDSGVLARFDGADQHIELVRYEPAPDLALLELG
jgi:hypothetical protein